MKFNNVMYNLICCFIFSLITSCDNNIYYKTFDYKTMTFIELVEKQDYCVKFISQTDTKIELEVIYGSNKVKRTFIKKGDHWYSKVKYELLENLDIGLAYGGIHEIEYYIFSDHIIYYYDYFTVYIDLIDEKIYLFRKLITDKNKNIELKELKKNNYDLLDYYVYFDVLHKRNRGYENGVIKDEVIEKRIGEPILDLFYYIDEEVYNKDSDCKFIYEDF